MTRVICKEDCGNAPKKLLIRDFNVAVAEGDVSLIGAKLADDVVWQLYEPGNQVRLEGKEAVLREYTNNRTIEPEEVVIDHILTHGKAGSANGAITADDGRQYVFCDVYVFRSHAKDAPIIEITSYIIEVEERNR